MADNFKEKNVETEMESPNSLMNFYKRIIRFRNENTILEEGNLTIDEELSNGKLFAFYRELDGTRFLVLMNFSNHEIKFENAESEIVFSTHSKENRSFLKPFEGRILKIDEQSSIKIQIDQFINAVCRVGSVACHKFVYHSLNFIRCQVAIRIKVNFLVLIG